MHTELKKNFLERRLDIHAMQKIYVNRKCIWNANVMHTEIKNLCLVCVVEKNNFQAISHVYSSCMFKSKLHAAD